jgi:23S rRNA (pseudouridine1915-N3)-methyltransferase
LEIQLIAVGTRMPSWVSEGYREYARRMPRECTLRLDEIPLGKRSGSKQPPQKAMAEEGRRMLAAVPGGNQVIALDVGGRSWSTSMLAEQMRNWMQNGRNLSLLIGGPDGLSPDCLERAEQRWSLSDLTLPHPLVRVLLAEQLYRAWTMISGHPYHRA